VSDYVPDRRITDRRDEFGERLARIEERSASQSEEMRKVRDRVHDIASSLSSVVTMQEDAKEARDEMAVKLDALVTKIEPVLITIAQLSTTMATHIGQCVVDKHEVHQKLTALEIDSTTRHNDNVSRFSRIEFRIALYAGIATGLGIAISAIINHGAFFHAIISAVSRSDFIQSAVASGLTL
jgi:chromosome segregation ATPase